MIRKDDDGIDLKGVVGGLLAQGGPQETQRCRTC